MEDREEIQVLFRKYLDATYTEDDLDKILEYLRQNEDDDGLVQLIREELDNVIAEDTALIADVGESIAGNLFQKTRPAKVRKIWRWLPYAASFFLVCVLGSYYFLKKEVSPFEKLSVAENIIPPGGNRATITLGNGKIVELLEDYGEISTKGNTLVYPDGSFVESVEISGPVKISTPRGGQYAVLLNDGTRVWLNSSSELVYPSQFGVNERTVEVEGEAYFEVAQDKNRPFVVLTPKQRVQVIGTHFNVQAYSDEEVQHTTLVEGVVRIVNSNDQDDGVYLKPGQQAVSKAGIDKLAVMSVDPQEYVSWKDGLITLNSYSLVEVVRQLERWYDVEFSAIPRDIGIERVFGMIDRGVPLNDVLRALESNYSHVRFKIEGRSVVVSRQ